MDPVPRLSTFHGGGLGDDSRGPGVRIDHLQGPNRTLIRPLEGSRAWMDPMVLGEPACGNLKNRAQSLDALMLGAGCPRSNFGSTVPSPGGTTPRTVSRHKVAAPETAHQFARAAVVGTPRSAPTAGAYASEESLSKTASQD